MKGYAFDINEIPEERPSEAEVKRKLAIYNLKKELGLIEPYDEDNNTSEINTEMR